jgi:hypothetical protein
LTSTPPVGQLDPGRATLRHDARGGSEAREDFFHNTWQGQVTSGALDLALNLVATRPMAGSQGHQGCGGCPQHLQGCDEIDRALKVNAGEAASASRRETALSGRMDKFFGQLDGKSSAEIALHPVVKESDQGGVFASLFGQINEQITDEAARRAAQRNVYGAMLGNAGQH